MSAEVMEALKRIEAKLDAMGSRKAAPVTVPVAGAVASDAELDSQWGDPKIKKSPPRWDGEDLAGKHYSECSVEALEVLVGFLEWKAGKDDAKGTEDGNKYAAYARKDAARARGWIKRKQDGWKPAPTSNAALFNDPPPDDDLPF